MCFAAASGRVYFNYTIGPSSKTRRYQDAKGTASFSKRIIHCFVHWFLRTLHESIATDLYSNSRTRDPA